MSFIEKQGKFYNLNYPLIDLKKLRLIVGNRETSFITPINSVRNFINIGKFYIKPRFSQKSITGGLNEDLFSYYLYEVGPWSHSVKMDIKYFKSFFLSRHISTNFLKNLISGLSEHYYVVTDMPNVGGNFCISEIHDLSSNEFLDLEKLEDLEKLNLYQLIRETYKIKIDQIYTDKKIIVLTFNNGDLAYDLCNLIGLHKSMPLCLLSFK